MGKPLEDLRAAIEGIEVERVEALVGEALKAHLPPVEILKAMSGALRRVGELYEEREYFLSELIMAAEAFNKGFALIKPHLTISEQGRAGVRVVIGTVKGDVHDIGKNIVSTLLASSGFDVVDLGVDVLPETFVSKVEETRAPLLALTTLLSTSLEKIEETLQALEKADLRRRVKVIVGGGAVNREYAERVGADAYGADALEAVKICRTLSAAATLKP